MTAATASGCEISWRGEPPRNVVTRARARRAMASCEAGVMILSPVLTKNQDGIVFQAAVREGVMNAAVDAPRWEAQSRTASVRGRSFAKSSTNTFSRRYSSWAPGAYDGRGTVLYSVAGLPFVRTDREPLSCPFASPGAGAAAST